MKERVELRSGAAVFSLAPITLITWVETEKQRISLEWTKLCGQKLKKSLGKPGIFRGKKKEPFWGHQQNSHLFFSLWTVVNTRCPQGSLRSSTSGNLYPFPQEQCTTKWCGKMEMPPISLGILRKEILTCWAMHAGGLMGCVPRNSS